MQEIRDGFHEILRNLHKVTLSSSALLRIAEREKYMELHEKGHIEKSLETIKNSCDAAKAAATEVEKLRAEVYKLLNIGKNGGNNV